MTDTPTPVLLAIIRDAAADGVCLRLDPDADGMAGTVHLDGPDDAVALWESDFRQVWPQIYEIMGACLHQLRTMRN